MILLVHMLLGAAIGSIFKIPLLAMILALFSHYFLDIFPHTEYPIGNIKNKQWQKAIPELLSVATDFFTGLLIILIFSSGNIIVYICALIAIMPDGLSLLSIIAPNKILEKHNYFHQIKIHFLKNEKISIFWRFFTQIIVVVISIILLRH